MLIRDARAMLDVSGGSLTNSFFHINGFTSEGDILPYHLLKNSDDVNGLTNVRFTNAHLERKGERKGVRNRFCASS